jgi:hypothetical protein
MKLKPALSSSPGDVLGNVDVGLLEDLCQPQNGFSVLKALEGHENWTSTANLRA